MKQLLSLSAIAALSTLGLNAANAQYIVDPTGGTVLFDSSSSWDDATANGRNLGFTLNYYGTLHSTVDVSVNGNLNFSGNGAFSNQALPNGSARISALWDDLYIFAGVPNSKIVETINPGKYYAVTWQKIGVYSDTASSSVDNFQAIIFGDEFVLNGFQFHTGDIAFDYNNYSAAFRGGNATVGLDGGDGSSFAALPGTTDGVIFDTNKSALLPIFSPQFQSGGGEFVYFTHNSAFGYNSSIQTLNGSASAVPEPGSVAMLAGLAVSGSAFALRRLRRKN